ncbi:MAG: hypothetical protein HYY92_01980 [Parcubacteria group bacterium]|nr:hypothetical protein [Parcubacteria group bacterium]
MTSKNADYTLFTDGGARGNPGLAGAGAVIKRGDTVLKKIAKPLGRSRWVSRPITGRNMRRSLSRLKN